MGWEKQKEEKWKEEAEKKQKEKEQRKKKRKKTKKEKNNGDKEYSRVVEDLGWRRRSSKVGRGGKKAGTKNISQVDPYLWHKKPVKECLQENYEIILLI